MNKLYASGAITSPLVEILSVFILLAVVEDMIYPYILHQTHAITRGNVFYSPGDRGFKLNQGG